MRRKADAMEDFTYGKMENSGVKYIRAQINGSVPVGGSLLMPSAKAEILELFPELTEREQEIILGSIKSLLSAQELASAAPASIGQ